MMRKIGALVLVFFVLSAMILTGCGKAEEPDAPLDVILSEIEGSVAMDSASRMSDADLLDLYGIQAADIAEQASLTSMNGIFPDEIIMVKAADEDALARIREKLENRLQEVLNQSKSYDAASYAVAQKCKVDVRGLYAALFVSSSHEKMTELYNAHF